MRRNCKGLLQMSFDMFKVEPNPIDLDDLVSRILTDITPLLSQHKSFKSVSCKTFDGKFDIKLDCHTEHEVHVTFKFERDTKAVTITQLQNNYARITKFLQPFEAKILDLIGTTHKCSIKHPLRRIFSEGTNDEVVIGTCLLLSGYRCPGLSRDLHAVAL